MANDTGKSWAWITGALVLVVLASSTFLLTRPRAPVHVGPPGTAAIAPPARPVAFTDAAVALDTPGFRVAAVHYWQQNWNYNFWSSFKESRLDRDFEAIRALGFNTVMTSVPWGYFQKTIAPPTYDDRAFAKLETLLDRAADHGLYVVLRVGTPELVPEGVLGGSYFNPFTIYEEAELAAYCDLYREVARRIGGKRNLLFVFHSWEDNGQLGPFKLSRPQREKFPGKPSSYVAYLRRKPIAYWNERWGTDYASYDEVILPDEGTPAARDFLTFADERLSDVVLPRVAAAARAGDPRMRLAFEIRVDAEPIWSGGRQNPPKWFFHYGTWNLPRDYAVIGAYFNPYWRARNDGGHISPKEAAANLAVLLDEIGRHTDGRPIFFDQFNFTDSTPYFGHNSRLRDEEAVAEFLELALPEIFRRSLGYAVWSFRAYEADVLYDSTFEDGLVGWETPEAREGAVQVLLDRERGERFARLRPGARLRQAVRAGWNPGAHSPEVDYTFRGMVRGESGARLRWTYETPRTDGGWRISASGDVAAGRGWTAFEARAPFSAVCRLTLEARGRGSLDVDELTLFNHVQSAAVLGPRGEPLGRRAEVLARWNTRWLGGAPRDAGPPARARWTKDQLTELPGVYDDGWVGGRLVVPVRVEAPGSKLVVLLFLPESETWKEGNEVEVWVDGTRVGAGRLRPGPNRIVMDLPDHVEPGERLVRLSFARTTSPARTEVGSTDDRRLAAIVVEIGVQAPGAGAAAGSDDR